MALANVLLTLNEVAELEGKSWGAINKSIQREKLVAIKIPTSEKCGFEYRIKLDDLSDKAKRKYYSKLKVTDESLGLEDEKEEKYVDSIEELSDKQRQEIAYWKKVLEDWREYISNYPGQTTEMTDEFIKIHNIQNPDMAIKERTLRQKWKDYRDYGDVALADHRANRKDKGKTSIHEVAWSVFLQWWLDENQPSTSHVYRLTCAWADLKMRELLPLPSEDTFRRAIGKVPVPVVKFFREGAKQFEDECLPYLVRQYDFIDSNDIWSADYHTLDMMVRDDFTGKVFRPHVIVWIDVRSRKVLGMRLCESSNSDGVILAFRDAVLRYGIPKEVYLDNGREFLVHDFGGRGKRKTDEEADYGSNMLERLGINMINARVKNAKAKVIERGFRKFSEEFAKLYITYCGNRPENRPERHNEVLKDIGNIPLLSQVTEELRTYIEGSYNMEDSKAEGLEGKSPNKCYAANLVVKRTATEEQLNLMLVRSTRLQSVNRNGVYLRFGEKKVFFYNEELIQSHFKKKVYVRYDSEDLSSIRVYDSEERFICTANRLEVGGYDQEKDAESIKAINSKIKKVKKAVKDYMSDTTGIYDAPEMREIMLEAARKNIENDKTSYDAKVVEPFSFMNRDKVEFEKAVGDDTVIDWDKMIRNAGKNNKEE